MDLRVREYDTDELLVEAEAFVRQCYEELGKPDAARGRIEKIRHSIAENGYYEHTEEELEHGARMAWRNAPRCIGRLYWSALEVRDLRHLTDPRSIHEACCDHLRECRSDGQIRPIISIFPPDVPGTEQVRIWNYQLLRYAGYETVDGIVGDPMERQLTAYCESRGWRGPETEFDFLPHVIQIGDDEPELFDLPEDVYERVPITHPEYDWFADLGLEWYDVPAVSSLCLDIGGIQYTAAPFNGWYVAPEIAARNFADEDRYDVVPEVAERMGLDTSRSETLWKDDVVVELNRAVLHSYEEAGVPIVDHHTAAERFEQFERNEQAAGREVAGDWTWLIPPISPATTHIFHTTYDDTVRTPNLFYQGTPYADE